jgi:hypothetical protein
MRIGIPGSSAGRHSPSPPPLSALTAGVGSGATPKAPARSPSRDRSVRRFVCEFKGRGNLRRARRSLRAAAWR